MVSSLAPEADDQGSADIGALSEIGEDICDAFQVERKLAASLVVEISDSSLYLADDRLRDVIGTDHAGNYGNKISGTDPAVFAPVAFKCITHTDLLTDRLCRGVRRDCVRVHNSLFDRVAGSSDTLSVFHDEIARGQITESNLVTIGDIVEKSDGFGMSFLIMDLNGHSLFMPFAKIVATLSRSSIFNARFPLMPVPPLLREQRLRQESQRRWHLFRQDRKLSAALHRGWKPGSYLLSAPGRDRGKW